MKSLLFAALLSLASVVATADLVQAAPANVWHHGTPVYVGRGTNHGTMMGARGNSTMRSWYSPRSQGRFFGRWAR